MAWNQVIDYEEVDVDYSRTVTVKKQLWDADTQSFIPATFVRVDCSNGEYNNTIEWLRDNYGPSQGMTNWWVTNGTRMVWMRDSIATFWMLKNSTC